VVLKEERKRKKERGEEKKVQRRRIFLVFKPGVSKSNLQSLSLSLSLSPILFPLLTVVIQSKVAAEFVGALLPEESSSGCSCEFLPGPLDVEMLPPGAAPTIRPTNERAGDERSCAPAAAVLGIAAEVKESVPSWSTSSRALGLAAT